jgi:hypothetical protein
MPALKLRLPPALLATALITLAGPALAAKSGGLAVKFSDCTEFVGVAPVALDAARALVPTRYQLVTDAQGAKLVVRVVQCKGVQVSDQGRRSGRVAQVGLMIQSPDGTATDPNTSINNYTLSYVSDHPSLVAGLAALGVPTALDTSLTVEATPVAANAQELYAAVAPAFGTAPTWFVHGTVNTPTVLTPFLANWWVLDGSKETKMATTLPLILFDFASEVSFTTSRQNLIGRLLQANQVARFPVSFRGAFAAGTMQVKRTP